MATLLYTMCGILLAFHVCWAFLVILIRDQNIDHHQVMKISPLNSENWLTNDPNMLAQCIYCLFHKLIAFKIQNSHKINDISFCRKLIVKQCVGCQMVFCLWIVWFCFSCAFSMKILLIKFSVECLQPRLLICDCFVWDHFIFEVFRSKRSLSSSI